MKLTTALLCAVVLTSASACRKKPEVATTAPPANAAPTGNEAQMAASNASVLTMMLQEFEGKNGRLPKDVSELSTIKSFGPAPKAPAGFKFEIDPAKKQVVAVKE